MTQGKSINPEQRIATATWWARFGCHPIATTYDAKGKPKKPVGNGWEHTAATPESYTTSPGFGIVPGPRLYIPDFDGKPDESGSKAADTDRLAREFAAAEPELFRRLATGYAERSMSDGLHFAYTVTGNVTTPHKILAKHPDGSTAVELLRSGMQFVPGRPVSHNDPAAFAPEEHLRIVAALQSLDRLQAGDSPGTEDTGNGTAYSSPRDHAEFAACIEKLTGETLTATGQRADGASYWHRDGAADAKANSVMIWSSRIHVGSPTLQRKLGELLNPSGGCSVSRLWAAAHHELLTDRDAAERYSTESTQYTESRGEPGSVYCVDSVPWDDPVPLTDRSNLPPFPVHVYPAWLADMVLAVTENMQVPPDLPGMVALGVLATALGGRARVNVRRDWVESVNLYVVTAMAPGSRKSPVHAMFIAPVLTAEHLLAEAATAEITEAKATKALALKAAAAAQAASLKADEKTAEKARADAIAATVLAESIEIPVIPRIVADDVTPEACASLMAEQGGRLAILSAEGGPFVTLAGRYSGEPNLEVFLKGWSGDMLRVDRKGRAPEYIQNPALTLCLTVQPEVLRQIAVMPGFNGRGLLARVLYAVPASNIGRRRVRTAEIPMHVKVAYTAAVGVLVRTYDAWKDPAVILLSEAAREMFLDAAEVLEPRRGAGGDLAHLAEWAAKLDGTTARIAALLHAANHHDGEAWNIPVSADTMAKALELAEYLEAHAVAAAGFMGSDPALADAEAVLDWLRRTGREQFSKRDVHSAMRARFTKADDVAPPLRVLREHGWIREAATVSSGPLGGRPPSPVYEVNPRITGEMTYTEPAQHTQPPTNRGSVYSAGSVVTPQPVKDTTPPVPTPPPAPAPEPPAPPPTVTDSDDQPRVEGLCGACQQPAGSCNECRNYPAGLTPAQQVALARLTCSDCNYPAFACPRHEDGASG